MFTDSTTVDYFTFTGPNNPDLIKLRSGECSSCVIFLSGRLDQIGNRSGGIMGFVKVADASELPPGAMKIVDVGGASVLLANVGGAWYAIANKCTHLGGSIGEGTLDGNVVSCPKHGARFDVTTGKAVGPAKIAFVKMTPKDEKTFPVRVDGDAIMVDAG
jgi:3-phenylpropionate/trans-cinnamate dioxygenase ferredoxin component